jgi:hypothetical protein
MSGADTMDAIAETGKPCGRVDLEMIALRVCVED